MVKEGDKRVVQIMICKKKNKEVLLLNDGVKMGVLYLVLCGVQA